MKQTLVERVQFYLGSLGLIQLSTQLSAEVVIHVCSIPVIFPMN